MFNYARRIAILKNLIDELQEEEVLVQADTPQWRRLAETVQHLEDAIFYLERCHET